MAGLAPEFPEYAAVLDPQVLEYEDIHAPMPHL
jgi:hypothetical protein